MNARKGYGVAKACRPSQNPDCIIFLKIKYVFRASCSLGLYKMMVNKNA